MGFSWGGLAKAFKVGIAVGGTFNKHLASVDALIDKIEEAIPDAPGTHKLATVEAVSDALIESDLVSLPVEVQEEVKLLRREYIALGVTIRNSTARTIAVSERIAALLKGA